MILNNGKLDENSLYELTLELVIKNQDTYCQNPYARVFYNKTKKWFCIYFSGVFGWISKLDDIKANVKMLARHFGSTVVHNIVIETNSIVMAMQGQTSDTYVIDRGGFLLYEEDYSVIDMDISKWLHLIENDVNTFTKTSKSEYDNEGERLRELWIQLGFNEIIATCDNNDYDWLVGYQSERIEDFVILDIRL
jgi:hypothetical protein